MDNDFILRDRLQKIQQIIGKYGEENFYISYSGGKDSNVLSALFDLALPENKIPRVYCNTGIEYKMIVDFVKGKAEKDERFIIITPKMPIKKTLEEKGYPFKSKFHSLVHEIYKNSGKNCTTVIKYLKLDPTVKSYFNANCCPDKLRYQFESPDAVPFKISDKYCHEIKTNPLDVWAKSTKKHYKILGIMHEEGGGRRAFSSQCLAFKRGKLTAFQPLIPITKEWEDWFIEKYDIELPVLYYPPYNFERTGCKGCPFAINLQKELDVLAEYFPNEKKQCEIIWKPVYSEYRRLGYRLKKTNEDQLTFDTINSISDPHLDTHNSQTDP